MNDFPMQLHPIGTVRSPLTPSPPSDPALSLAARIAANREKYRQIAALEVELVLDAEWAEALRGLAEFSHLWVIYWAHLRPAGAALDRVLRPMGRADLPLTGLLATRSPCRPNPILLTLAELVRVEGCRVVVRGLEALDGSPILDLKPCVPGDCPPNARFPDWARRIYADTHGA